MANPSNKSVNPEFVERYQLELSKNPRSRVFAPLAEAYRKMGLLEEARRICRFGCQAHPDFAGGHVAYAKVLIDFKTLPEALSHLESAAKLSPDNLLAHTLMGETLIELRRPKEALKAFKMVLFLDPDNTRANEAVRKWEFLTADEYSDDVFAMKPLFKEQSKDKKATEAGEKLDDELDELLTQVGLDPKKVAGGTGDSKIENERRQAKALERAVSLADAFTVRNDLTAALTVLEDARRLLGPLKEIETRYRLLNKRLEILNSESDEDDGDDDSESEVPVDFRPDADLAMPEPARIQMSPALARKRVMLEQLLRRINDRR